jgi:hypothetical protein
VTATDLIENVELENIPGMTIATAQQVGQAVVRGLRWRQAEVFIGITESLLSRWNDLAPWAVDIGVGAMRERMAQAVRHQRTV